MQQQKPSNGPQQTKWKVATSRVATHYQILRIPFMVVVLLYGMAMLVVVSAAHASEEVPTDLSALPSVQATWMAAKPKVSPKTPSPLIVTGKCHNGVAVFSVKNGSRTWTARGWLSIRDASTGRVVRQRMMRFGDGQSASFRIGPDLVPSHRYRVSVTLPSGEVKYMKSFRGRCPQPYIEIREARR